MASSSLTRISGHALRRTLSFPIRSLHEGPDTIDELLDRHLAKNAAAKPDDGDELTARRLTGARREALSLYRDVIRASRFYTWPDARGVMWRDVLRENARKEFEAARFERDPEVVTKLLIGGREAVEKAVERLVEGAKKMAEKEEQERSQGRR
ncbi:hypothetical protein LUZ60_014490 [Juncus effusus]|nr:hypothetical protein LUZ60_014490 [Juncus effusus]